MTRRVREPASSAKAVTGAPVSRSGVVAGPVVAVLVISAGLIGLAFAASSIVGAIVAFFIGLAPIAVAIDGGPVLVAFRRGLMAALRSPGPTAAVLSAAALVLILINLLRLVFSVTVAQFGTFSFGVQAAAAQAAGMMALRRLTREEWLRGRV